MGRIILFLYLTLYTFVISSDLISTIPRKEKAVLNIQVTKLNTEPLKIESIDYNNKKIFLEKFNINFNFHSILVGENSENFNALFSVNSRLPALKNIIKETNLSHSIDSNFQISISYQNFPNIFYVGILNRRDKHLEKIYRVDPSANLIQLTSYSESNAQAKIELFYSSGQTIYIPDYKSGCDYILPVGKVIISNSDIHNWIDLAWKQSSNYVHFKTVENNGWINQGAFRFRQNSEIRETIDTGTNSEWEIIFVIPWESIRIALEENSPLYFKNNQKTFFDFQRGEFPDASSSLGPFIISFGESDPTPQFSPLTISGSDLKDGHISLNYGNIDKNRNEDLSIISNSLILKREEEDPLFSNSQDEVEFSFSSGKELILKNLSSTTTTIKSEISISKISENFKFIEFRINSFLSSNEIEQSKSGDYFGSTILNITIK